jgi:cob(I)alamin adenosyltransferase
MLHVYTGKGKGKTTAALGLALRASGHGLRVYIAQFVKGMDYGELRALKKVPNIKLEQFGRKCFIRSGPQKRDYQLARECLERVRKAVLGRRYKVIVLDEVNVAVKLGLVRIEEVLALVREAPASKELVLTGRGAHPRLVRQADLVSRIEEVKHYYRKGVRARKGIEY